jgi:hypothetical protein
VTLNVSSSRSSRFNRSKVSGIHHLELLERMEQLEPAAGGHCFAFAPETLQLDSYYSPKNAGYFCYPTPVMYGFW